MTPTPRLIYGKGGCFKPNISARRDRYKLWFTPTTRFTAARFAFRFALLAILAFGASVPGSLAPSGTDAHGAEGGGTLHSIEQGAVLAIDNGTLNGNGIRFEVYGIGGVYEGVLNRARSQMAGTWTQRRVPPQPLSLRRSATGAPSKPAAQAPAIHTPKPIEPSLNIVVPIGPTAFQADRKWHLVYELHVTNLGKWDCLLTRLDVLAGDAGAKPIASSSGAELDGRIVRPGQDVTEKAKIGPGAFAIVYLWVTLDRREDVPAKITHRIAMKVGDYPEGITLDGVPVAVDRGPVVAIAPPLRGEDWVAANGPTNTSAHRRAFIPINGHAYISQRFAIDWVQNNPDGNTYTGDSTDNKNYRAYGAQIHAVADGVVTQTKDGIPQNVPNQPPVVPINLESVGGNHVIMEIGSGLYAFYAHMQPGSVRVKVGDKVRRGQVLGLLGNSGNSSEPHLHFHICNANSELGSEGLPYAFGSYELQGRGESWKPADSQSAPVRHEMEIPLEDEVVRFPEQP
jgi:murein DD-endopeptidase MepM/ murein hydrolase activator NlpD